VKGTVVINGKEFETLLAISETEQMRGLMGVEPPTPIMSFIYDSPRTNAFWMKGTPAPLDIVFCNGGRVVAIRNGEPHSTKLIGGDCVSDLVIEFPAGSCKAVGITEGAKIDLRISQAAKINLLMVKLGIEK
jgi:uncharacterized protein